jgi:hypothetical protein
VINLNKFERDENLSGLYAGIVEDVNDPELIGRVRVRVAHVYGPAGAADSIDTTDIPWAFPAGLPAGGSAASGGISWLPEPGDQVYVQFLDGEPEKPVWFWGNQNKFQKDKLKLHQYEQKKVVRAGLTRYGHTIEFNSSSIIATSQSGYAVILEEGLAPAQGKITLMTPQGQIIEMSDETQMLEVIVPEVQITVDRMVTAMAEAFDLEAFTGTFTLRTAQEIVLQTQTDVNILFNGFMFLGRGTEPFVLGFKLVELLTSLQTWALTHTHSNGNMGSPTGAPITPWVPSPTIPLVISQTIYGE